MLKAFAATETAKNVASETGSEITNLVTLFLTRIPLWITAFIVAFISVLAAKIARRIVENKLAEKGIEEEHKELQILGGRIAYTTVLTLGITVALKIAGIDLTTILAAVAFGIGFALKDLIMNFLAGIMILVSRHFTIGDFVKVGSTVGRVVEIQSRTTILQAIDGTKVIVPNAEIFKKQVTSFTSNPFRRIELLVSIDYRNNLENALNICMKVLNTTKGVLSEPKPAVLIDEFGDHGMGLKIRAWVSSRGGWLKIKSALAQNIKKEFDQHGITIPWPIRTIVNDKENPISEKELEQELNEDTTSKETFAQETSPATSTPATEPYEVQNVTLQNPAPVSQPMTPAPEKVENNDQPLKPLSEF